jgi:hypothetical protein
VGVGVEVAVGVSVTVAVAVGMAVCVFATARSTAPGREEQPASNKPPIITRVKKIHLENKRLRLPGIKRNLPVLSAYSTGDW